MSKLVRLIAVLCIVSVMGCETPDSLVQEGNTAAAWQKFDQALKKYEAALAKDPSHLDAMLGKAKALEGAKRFKEAEEWYKKVLDKKKGHKETIERLAGMFTERGKNLYKEKKFDEAAAWYQKITALDVPAALKKTAKEHARECTFQGFFAGIKPKLEKLPGFDKKQGVVIVSGRGEKPRKGSVEDAQKAALEAAHAELNKLAHSLSSKAKDPKALKTEPVANAVPASGDWVKPKKIFELKLAIPLEKLARVIFDINQGA